MTGILTGICADKAEHVARCKKERSLDDLYAAAEAMAPARGFAAALDKAVRGGGYGLIAEIKRASPSRGVIRADFNPAELAVALEAGGAACLSVLTDVPYFQGSDDFLVKAQTAGNLPALRKDFMIDPYQIVESRALGADCVLLIMAVLDDAKAGELAAVAVKSGMDVLVEVHDEAELERALRLDARLIGINNRDLDTFKTDLAVTERLAPLVPKDRIVVSESGLSTSADLARMSRCGVNCFLIGEAIMSRNDAQAALRNLLSEFGR
ncbi:MAG: indole-3-glycerol phosphate synthase [Rhodospirillales bacterium RIFCSPLOWO2_12_FULL_58_28]|nr:MAG: indole-3-glycerol phosphate synthase [Rhodospirillales bacterium RIFCSPLOWO2_02_FULL_58_16]OHC79021.1 MAG: indole-3-glycerol phosphate synthase [Rhodospirillales bacterium RIFCSPLOWO2_12_FULL_58_28]